MQSRPRGIVLISILVLTLLATFFLGALIQMNPSRLRRTSHDEKRDRAAMAARAGVDYALNRLRSDWEWKAGGDRVVVESENIVIREDQGNVLGWIRPEGEGEWVGFRLRFNLQDGSNNPRYPILSKEISLNNLRGGVEVALPVGRGSGFEASTEGSEVVVPAKSIALLVEGVNTPGLTPEKPAALAEANTGIRRTVEGIYIISDVLTGSDGDAVLMTGGHADIKLGPPSAEHGKFGFLELMADSDNVAGVRNKGTLNLSREGTSSADSAMFLPDQRAEVSTHSSQFQALTTDNTMFSGGSEDINSPFIKLQASEVFAREGDAVTIPGGVYIFKNGDKDSGRSLADDVQYFDMTWDQYRAAKMDDDPNTPVPAPQVPADFLAMVELDSKTVTINGESEKRDVIKITKNVKVEGGDLSIVPERGARQEAGTDPEPGEEIVEGEGELIDASAFTSLPPAVQIGVATTLMEKLIAEAPSIVRSKGPGGAIKEVMFTTSGPYASVGEVYSVSGGGFTDPAQAAIFTQTILAGGKITFPGEFEVNPPPTGFTPDGPYYAINRDEFLAGANVDDLRQGTEVDPETTPTTAKVDPLHIPKKPDAAGNPPDETVPQDIEIEFAPPEGETAFITNESGKVFLGTHISGQGGGVAARGDVNLVGFGISLHARPDNIKKDGIAFFSGDMDDGGNGTINISTYDERRNRYWDVDIAGTIYANKELKLRLGQTDVPQGIDAPEWGYFKYSGAIVSLGDASTTATSTFEDYNFFAFDDEKSLWQGDTSYQPQSGHTSMIAAGVSLFYDPRFLAPYIEKSEIRPTFAAISVVER